ncbi:hypothetical protein BF93_03680 [Brachybacterium phenoliresistens]|uniref:Lipoprotein n=1 Tax=Brachybacterium phenoliresistens TaxID=396014 RepID=Z9JRV9_9MICO|nr:hypothetical protein [Brachybacterium phenoliresistens]EWS80492.1 hypothetical protein BF93_03680 [Brachybacterium phenoliresistens]
MMRRDPRPGSTEARLGAAALVAAALLALAGCSGGQPIPAQDVVAHYDEVAADAAAAGAAGGREFELQATTRTVAERDGDCLYRAGDWTSSVPFDGSASDEGAWDEYVAPYEDVLREHGFGGFGPVARRGALHYAEARDEHGAIFTIDAQGRFSISDARVETDRCTPEALGLA